MRVSYHFNGIGQVADKLLFGDIVSTEPINTVLNADFLPVLKVSIHYYNIKEADRYLHMNLSSFLSYIPV